MSQARLFFVSIFLLVRCVLPGVEPPRTTKYDVHSGLAATKVGGGVMDRHGLLWFATWNGLNCYDGYDFHWVKIHPGDGTSISTNHIRDILLSTTGNIICRTDAGIHEFDLSTYTFRAVTPSAAKSLAGVMGRRWRGLTDAQGNRWTADRSGLYKTYNPHHPARILEGTEGLHPRSLLVARDGRLWVGLRKSREIKIYGADLKLQEVIPLSTAPYCLFQTRSGDIWVGGKPGALFRPGKPSISPYAVYDIKEDRRGRLWVATFGGGVRCCANPKADNPTLSGSIGGNKVRKLLITPSGNLVAATTEGLLIGRIDERDCAATVLRSVKRDGNDPSSLCSDATMSLAQDAAGNIYVGTESSGVDVISEKSLFSDHPVFTHLDRRGSTLPSDACNALALVGDTLLMVVGGDNVMAYNPQSGHTVNYGNTFWADTCRFAETTPVVLPDGTQAFGADGGLFLATPHNLYTRGFIPPVVFTTLGVNGGGAEFCLAPKSEVELSADQRNVTIGFAAIDYIDNSGILYRTRLDGSPWTAAGTDRSVTLFNMTPGTHELEVQSTDRYGRWVNNARTLTLTVEPFWYETWWARTLFVIMGAAFIAGVISTWLYIRKVNRQRAELLEKYMALIKEFDLVQAEASKAAAVPGEEETPLTPEQKPEESAFLNRVRRYIEDNISNPEANVDDMAAAAATSRSTLNRHLRSQLGVSAAQLLIEARMQRAELLLGGEEGRARSAADVAALCGYSDVQYFQRVFKKRHGMSIAEYRDSIHK